MKIPCVQIGKEHNFNSKFKRNELKKKGKSKTLVNHSKIKYGSNIFKIYAQVFLPPKTEYNLKISKLS